MQILILTLGILLGYFIHAVGVKQGVALQKDKDVKIVPTPIKSVQERKEKVKSSKAEAEKVAAINNLMDYTGFKQYEQKEGKQW